METPDSFVIFCDDLGVFLKGTKGDFGKVKVAMVKQLWILDSNMCNRSQAVQAYPGHSCQMN